MKHLPRPSSPLATRARTWLWRATIRPASLLVTSGKHWSQVCKQAVFWDSPPEKDAHHGMLSLDPGNSYYTTKREPGSLSPEGSMLRKVKSMCLFLSFFFFFWRREGITDAVKKIRDFMGIFPYWLWEIPFLANAQRKTHRTATESVLWAESAIVVGSLPRKSIGRDVW